MSARLFAALLATAALAGCARQESPEEAIARAQQLIEAGKPGEARVRMKSLLVEHPDVAEARLLLTRIALDAGEVKIAADELSQLSAEQQQDPRAQALRGWVDLALGNHAEVVAAIEQGKLVVPGVEGARIHATALRAAGRPADALEILRAAADEAPQDDMVAVDLADTLAALGNLQQAQYELDEFLKRVPGSPAAHAARGALHFRTGAADKAVEDLRSALDAGPTAWGPPQRINLRVLLGEAALATGDVALAREQRAGIEKEFPGAIGGRLLDADIALFEGRAGDAADALQVVAKAAPSNVRVQYMLADAWVRSGNHTRAIDLLERRVREAPTDTMARRMLASLIRKTRPDRVVELLGDLPEEDLAVGASGDNLLASAREAQVQAVEALELVQQKLARNPDDADLQIELAAAYLRNGQPTRALSTLHPLNATLTSPAAAGLEMRAYIAAGNDREVNRLVGTLIQARTASPDTLLAAADAAQAGGRNDAAARLVNEALGRDPKNTNGLMRRANLEFLERDYPAARATLQQLVDTRPDDARARAALARVAEASGDLESATAELKQAMKLAPRVPEPALMLAALHLRTGSAAEATRVFDEMIAGGAKDGVAANLAGLLLLSSGRPQEALPRFREALEQAPQEATFAFNLGRAQVLANDRRAAIESFERAVKLRPTWVEASVHAAQLNLEAGRLARAAEITEALAAKLPNDPASWMMKGQIALAESRVGDAAAAFARSYALRPSAAAAVREHQARVASNALRPAQPLQNWLTQEPTDINVRRILANYYQRTGATRELIPQLERILEQAPNDAVTLNNLAWTLVKTDPARAESLARRAHAIAPQQPAFADTLGVALIENGKYADAVKVLDGAVQGLPQDPSVRTRYALALARSGDAPAARRELQVALRNGGAFDERATAEKLLKELGT